MPGAAESMRKAWDARTAPTRARHARAALAADPDELDGYVLLAQSLDDPGERLALLNDGAARGRRRWAVEMKRPAQSHFWLDPDTRPFMRVLHLLALESWQTGDAAGAIGQARTLLRLNRNDNQGIRDLLADWHGATGDWEALAKLLARYPDDWSTSHHYSRWLLAFRNGTPTDAALSDALDVNPHVPRFLADADLLPDEDADNPLAAMGYVAAGSPGEAHDYAQGARDAWQNTPAAIERLVCDAAAALR